MTKFQELLYYFTMFLKKMKCLFFTDMAYWGSAQKRDPYAKASELLPSVKRMGQRKAACRIIKIVNAQNFK